jgi:anhydro-N-acetylmuramic acid kinase
MSSELYLGLISGTSADGIDVALVDFSHGVRLLYAATYPYAPELRAEVLALTQGDGTFELDQFGRLDVRLGEAFASAATDLLRSADIRITSVRALGSHGQTMRHRPDGPHPFTLQLADASVIAERTGILTVADFRRADVAAGGQGAPLLPVLHAALLAQPGEARAVLNLGGIANLTLLGSGGSVRGFDTGPANALLDAWCQRHTGTACDTGGALAASGHVDPILLAALLREPYFALPAPKSTGREYFHLRWLDAHLAGHALSVADVQATLLALTAHSIAAALQAHAPDTRTVYACGGGVHNPALMRALKQALPCTLLSTAAAGVDPDFIEAMAFAWLARERLRGRAGNLPEVTGARGPRVLGAVHAPWPALHAPQ